MKYFIGIDLGTQSSKGLLFSPEGAVIAEASSEYIPDFPKPGWAEDDPLNWVRALKDILASLKSQAGISGLDIGTIAFASQNGGIVPIDCEGLPLAKSINWMDCRAIPQYEELCRKLDNDTVLNIVGSALSSDIVLAKTMWYKDNMPDIFEKAAAYVQPGEFMVAYLTGNIVGDYAHASVSTLYDVPRRQWSSVMFEAGGIDPDKAFEIKAAAEPAGSVKKELAEELGLSPTTVISVGSGDSQAAHLGCGLNKPGLTLDVSGTCEVVAGLSKDLLFDETGVIWTHLFPDPAYTCFEQSGILSGACVRWFKDTIARTSYDEMLKNLPSVPIGSDGLLFLPYLQGSITPVVDANARGVFIGLTMNHSVDHMCRAVYEGVTFSFRNCYEHLVDLNAAGDLIIACGGGTKAGFWNHMKADMTGVPVQLLESSNPTAVGAGMIAGVTQGVFRNYEEAAERLVKRGIIIEPDHSLKAAYDEAYEFYYDTAQLSYPMFKHYEEEN